ncbi:carbohydrate-binding protein [Rhizobium oryzicola]|uniref:Carbohydrate-binding protein n=1 Tax=Rhizobium oryzicola TaxID=1232668 RepID=A0ABT8SZ02_9HYPH|nr:carbohydrate-binding protein [Rhizobium oryzicola]MDO1582862.1 carbohydrate-binding protein [Rhizobium oryzicola]
MQFTLKVVDAAGQVKAESSAEDELFLVYRGEYEEGDRLLVSASEAAHVYLLLDTGLMPGIVYLKESPFSLAIPFGEKRMPYAQQAFLGTLHRLHVRVANPSEVAARRNLAFNPFDQHGNEQLFPHAVANVETRGESQFAARNAIDGEKATFDHGTWPFTSWGINKDPNAELTVHFGRPVLVDELVIYLRADFPHDAWWNEASITFSDSDTMRLDLVKSGAAQRFAVAEKKVEWLRIHSMKKADDPSPYPALSQIEAWGREA